MYAIYKLDKTLIQDGFYSEADALDWAAENDLDVEEYVIKRYSMEPDQYPLD